MKKLKEAYSQIDIEDKRNELNKEILSLLMLTNTSTDLYNYVKNNNITEDEFLTGTYIQIMQLRKNIISLLREQNKK